MTKEEKARLFNLLKEMKEEGITGNQYDLEELSEYTISADLWSELLREPDVREYRKKEIEIIRESEIFKMIKDSSQSRSVGQSQLMNALGKLGEQDDEDKGPAFIYCYVPLTEEQMEAKNVLPFKISNDFRGMTRKEFMATELREEEE